MLLSIPDARWQVDANDPSGSFALLQVIRAKIVLRVAAGSNYQDAARAVGRRNREAVSHLVTRFNQEGLTALSPRHGGGQKKGYTDAARERILQEYARTPTPEQDGTAVWSLSTLQKALRTARDGLPRVSTYTLWNLLKAEGQTHQKNRTQGENTVC